MEEMKHIPLQSTTCRLANIIALQTPRTSAMHQAPSAPHLDMPHGPLTPFPADQDPNHPQHAGPQMRTPPLCPWCPLHPCFLAAVATMDTLAVCILAAHAPPWCQMSSHPPRGAGVTNAFIFPAANPVQDSSTFLDPGAARIVSGMPKALTHPELITSNMCLAVQQNSTALSSKRQSGSPPPVPQNLPRGP